MTVVLLQYLWLVHAQNARRAVAIEAVVIAQETDTKLLVLKKKLSELHLNGAAFLCLKLKQTTFFIKNKCCFSLSNIDDEFLH